MKSNVTAEKGNLEGRKQEKILDKYKIIKEVRVRLFRWVVVFLGSFTKPWKNHQLEL
jgi:hypothetical protein